MYDIFIIQLMSKQSLPIPLQTFISKLGLFTAFNAGFLVWIFAELIFFIATTSNISCSGMKKLFIVWTCSYAFQLLVPIMSMLIVSYSKFHKGGFVYICLIIVYKLAVIISMLVVAWNHVGLCYIPYSMRVTILVINSLQIFCLSVETLLLWRIKKVNRQVLLNNLINKKTFAEN